VWDLEASILSLEVDPNNEMSIPWKRFLNVYIGQSNDGGDKHVIRLQSKMTLHV
jgi:hypothetical protein